MTDVLIDGPNHLRITEMWAYLSIDPDDDNEGLLGVTRDGVTVGLVGADPLMMEKLRPMVDEIVGRTKKKIQLVKFTNRVLVEEIG